MKPTQRLIVIEPNPDLRELIVDYLAWLGFDAFDAPDPAAALRVAVILQQDELPFSYLVTDHALARQMLNESAAYPPGSVRRFLILQSPFSPRELRQALL